MRAFKRFLKDYPESYVPAVLLSSRGQWEFVPSASDHDIGTLRIAKPAAIIDGQHRLGGYVALYEEHEQVRDVDFVVLAELSLEEEKSEFITVNNTQKGVPKALVSYLTEEDPAKVAWALNEEEDSPFKGRISRTGMQRQHLFALHSVAKQVERTFDFGPLQDLDVETKVEFMIRYWTIIADALPEEWADINLLDDLETKGRAAFGSKLLELTGLVAWSLAAKHVLGRSFNETAGMNWENVRRLVDACKGVDWRKDGQYQNATGEVGGPMIARDMERLLPADTEP